MTVLARSLQTAKEEEELRQALELSRGQRGPPLLHIPFRARQWLLKTRRRLRGHADDGASRRAGGAALVPLPLDDDEAMVAAQLDTVRAEEEERASMLQPWPQLFLQPLPQPPPRSPPHGTPQTPIEQDWLQGSIQAIQDLSRRFRPSMGGSLEAEPRHEPNHFDPQGRELAMGLVFPTEFALERLERRARECLLLESEVRARLEMASWDKAEQRNSERGRLETDLLRVQGAAEAAMREAEAARLRERAAREEQARREEQRRQEEQARLRREREEAERQKREREAEEQASLRAMQQHNAENRKLGVGDFRMCRKCRAGPVTNDHCSNLQTHNNDAPGGANRCRSCGWFSKEWHDWPMWDGVFGPH